MPSRDIKALLQAAAADREEGFEEPFEISRSEITRLTLDDLPDGLPIQVVDRVDSKGTHYMSLDGTLHREGDRLVASIEELGWRKFWPGPLGIEDYHSLVLAAAKARATKIGDLVVTEQIDDNVHGFIYEVELPTSGSLGAALDRALAVRAEVSEGAEAVRAGVQDLVDRTEKRLAGWGSRPLDEVLDRITAKKGTADQRGADLEELTTRLFSTVPGFQATGRVRTSTEEIDIQIQNSSEAGRWRRESYLLLAECKNWSTKCGKDEFVLFKSKLTNRVGRVSCGFLVSWNGFAETVTKEMLRGSNDTIVVVALKGADLRDAVRHDDFAERLERAYEASVFA